MEHIKLIRSLESKLHLISICSIRIPSRNRDIIEKPLQLNNNPYVISHCSDHHRGSVVARDICAIIVVHHPRRARAVTIDHTSQNRGVIRARFRAIATAPHRHIENRNFSLFPHDD